MAKRKRTARRREPTRVRIDTEAEKTLLSRRLCDLGLAIPGSPVEPRLARLDKELAAKGLAFRPHVWLSTSFFSPDGVPGFAVPLYLAHPRLTRLELRLGAGAEGADEDEFMRIARHETGHAVLSAYGLHKRKRWRELFGRYSEPYLLSYKPDPRSRAFVRNLGGWYAQSHPAEDFCETFAVWLRPRSAWRRKYVRFKALEKLEYVDSEMRRIRDLQPTVRNRERLEPVERLRTTLGAYLTRRANHYGADFDPLDQGLFSVFGPPHGKRRTPSASAYLRRLGPHLIRAVVGLTGKDSYDVEQVLRKQIERARYLGLSVPNWTGRSRAITALVAIEVLKLHRGRLREHLR